MKNKINWPNDKPYKWWAMDENGNAWFYEAKPYFGKGDRNWTHRHRSGLKLDTSFANPGNFNWKESLVCRDDEDDFCEVTVIVPKRDKDNIIKIAKSFCGIWKKLHHGASWGDPSDGDKI